MSNLLFSGNAIDGGKQVVGELSTEKANGMTVGVLIGKEVDGWMEWTPINPKTLVFFGDMT